MSKKDAQNLSSDRMELFFNTLDDGGATITYMVHSKLKATLGEEFLSQIPSKIRLVLTLQRETSKRLIQYLDSLSTEMFEANLNSRSLQEINKLTLIRIIDRVFAEFLSSFFTEMAKQSVENETIADFSQKFFGQYLKKNKVRG